MRVQFPENYQHWSFCIVTLLNWEVTAVRFFQHESPQYTYEVYPSGTGELVIMREEME